MACQYEGADCLGRQRRQQNSVAMMSGCDDQPVYPARTQHRGIVSRTRTEAHPSLGHRKLLDARHRAPGALDQRQQAACRDPVVEAALLDGPADHEPSVPARHQIAPRKPHDVPQQRARRIHAQRQHLTFDRTDRGEMSRWNSGDLARPGAGSEHDNICRFAAVLGHGRGYTPPGDLDLSDRIVLVKYGPCLAGRFGESLAEPTVVDLMISRAEDRAGDARPQVRLSPPRLRPRQPFEIEPEALLKIKGEAQLLGVVAGQSDDDRALVAIADRDAGYRLEFVRKIRPHALTLKGQARAAPPRPARSRPRRRAFRQPPSSRRVRPRPGRRRPPSNPLGPAARRSPTP